VLLFLVGFFGHLQFYVLLSQPASQLLSHYHQSCVRNLVGWWMYKTGLHPRPEANEGSGDVTLACGYSTHWGWRSWNFCLSILFSLNFRGCAPISKFVLILTFSHVISMNVAIFSGFRNWVFF
jgi:hypothetical protein